MLVAAALALVLGLVAVGLLPPSSDDTPRAVGSLDQAGEPDRPELAGGAARRPCAGLAAPGRSSPALSEVVGVTSHTMWAEDTDPDAEFALMASCGIRATREDLLWEVIEPQRGVMDWARPDALFRAAARHDVAVLGILGYSAPWATGPGAGADRSFPPVDEEAFARYAAAVAGRYGSAGTFWRDEGIASRPLLGLELWNEPWGWWNWEPDPEPARYARLAERAAAALDQADPEVRIVLPADRFQVRSDGSQASWFETVAAASPALLERVDVYSLHPYTDPRSVGPLVERTSSQWDYRRAGELHALASKLGLARPVWITEFGWSTAEVEEGVSEEVQRDNVRDAIELAIDRWPFVERLFVYTWTRDREKTDDIESGFGLRRRDGSPKPALTALVEMLGEPSSQRGDGPR